MEEVEQRKKMRLSKALRDAKKVVELANYPNVQGVGIGYKRREGKVIKEISIIVLVTKKINESDLPKESVVPKSIATTDGNIKTDVVESGEFLTHSDCDLTIRKRPLSPGYSIGHGGSGSGTIGLIVKKDRTASSAY
jgi:hypothetical protein